VRCTMKPRAGSSITWGRAVKGPHRHIKPDPCVVDPYGTVGRPCGAVASRGCRTCARSWRHPVHGGRSGQGGHRRSGTVWRLPDPGVRLRHADLETGRRTGRNARLFPGCRRNKVCPLKVHAANFPGSIERACPSAAKLSSNGWTLRLWARAKRRAIWSGVASPMSDRAARTAAI
jgi:hypothetical protein